MAAVAAATGDVDQAEHLLDEATTVLQHAGPWFLTRAMFVRSILALRRGNADETIALVRDCLTHIRELHDKFALVYALVPLAAAAARKGDDTWAARIWVFATPSPSAQVPRSSSSLVHDLREQTEREARARLGPDRWARAYAAGRKTSLDSVLEDIDSGPGGSRRRLAPSRKRLRRSARL